MDWTIDPYGGGVHLWNRGFKSWEILEQMTQPVKDFPCYICGEAYSTNQTWVEGALQTAEIVLQKLGLAKPSWITPNPEPVESPVAKAS
jgi:monoamine oxidase